ncbi:serine/threonine phosphatase [Geothrix limicola]|uniref:Serine/threonine phosphatase n=1 Tax=Geothrix limicola TaxID=2927978 RepID=A0ABQ5QK15_9BACT|nr:PP2C family protein-serine/threonine phosphatase [Geothrix limicola]GLH74942.1 serine/threonine phosphatase [Geothrix limicola]
MSTSAPPFVIELDHAQEKKTGQSACGDVFQSRKLEGGSRVVSVLADGLGSGIKAAVLANLTATMAARYAAEDADIVRAARTILETLPVCSERKIAYSTFTLVDMDRRGETRIVEYDNPPFLLIRGGDAQAVPYQEHRLPTPTARDAVLREARFQTRPGDRIVMCSDGVTQAGAGQRSTPLGWGSPALAAFLHGLLKQQPGISARQLAQAVTKQALALDGHAAKDDISCGVIYLRKPREVMLFTGAPVDRAVDRDLAKLARSFPGRKVICGGTTAAILSRELGLPLQMNLRDLDPHLPPVSSLEGFDLVTEGALTLAAAARLLGEHEHPEWLQPNAATLLAGVLLDSDVIHIVAGTKINDALQDPSFPQDLDIRRNILKRIQRVLSEKFLKEVRVQFV